jgi:hypothetical protein
VPSNCNVVHCFFLRIPLMDTTYFGLTDHQVYRLLWLRILLLIAMRFSFLQNLLSQIYTVQQDAEIQQYDCMYIRNAVYTCIYIYAMYEMWPLSLMHIANV